MNHAFLSLVVTTFITATSFSFIVSHNIQAPDMFSPYKFSPSKATTTQQSPQDSEPQDNEEDSETATALDSPNFLEGFQDIPVIAGFEHLEDEHIQFDTPTGTLAQTYLSSDKQNGLSLYQSALTSLGWDCTIDGILTCYRTFYKLVITAEETRQKPYLYHLQSSPVNAEK